MLSELPEAEIVAIVRKSGMKTITAKTITTLARLKTEMKAVRARGMRLTMRKRRRLALRGAVVRAHSRKLSAAMVFRAGVRMTRKEFQKSAKALMQAASELSAELGYPGLPLEALRRAAS